MRIRTTIEQIQQLPLVHRDTIIVGYLDVMGHMNVRHYMGIFDEATWRFFDLFGINTDYAQREKGGMFALKMHITYVAEVHLNQVVAIYSRILARNAKRLHFLHFMVNETTQQLAATIESVGSHADLNVRRTVPFPAHIAVKVDNLLAQHQALDWDAPLCGVLRV